MGSSRLSRGAGLVALLVAGVFIEAQASWAAPRGRPDQQAAVPATRVFGADAAVVLNFIKPDKTADFEAVIARLKQALQTSKNPVRVRQAASWKVFRAQEPGGNGSVLYLFVVDPAVKGADYTVSNILAEAFPDEVQALYKQYADCYASGQNFVNLAVLQSLGEDLSSTK